MTVQALPSRDFAVGSEPRDLETYIRALLAIFIVAATFLVTNFNPKADAIPKEWEAIFVLVIGYYFADRPHSDIQRGYKFAGTAAPPEVLRSTRIELSGQFVVALVLVAATAALFVTKIQGAFRPALAAAWIAGVGVAVGFYFKKTDTAADPLLATYRVILAILITGAAVGMVVVRGFEAPPLQWIALVVITVAFYFKERT